MSETEPQFKGPAIAVVVPVHNGAAFLQQCLASLAAQTFGDFACFVVDDGSTDESAELAAAWESRDARFVVIHQRQSGVAAARAAGVRAGLNLNARWFAFCDADDCYHKQFLDALYHAAQTTRCQIACCRYDCFTEDIPPESPPPSQTTVFQPPAHLDALLHDHRVDFGLWNKLYAHELITAEIMDNGLAYNEDLVANWQIFSAADGCAYVDFAGYHYRQHAASASHRALPPESIDQQRQAAVFIREHASPAIQQSANAFYYEKLVYLASMILRRDDAAAYRVQINELGWASAPGCRTLTLAATRGCRLPSARRRGQPSTARCCGAKCAVPC